MLLELDNTSTENIYKLLAFAQQNNMHLKVIDNIDGDYHLPGKALTENQLDELIDSSRNSSIISMHDAHKLIRKNLATNHSTQTQSNGDRQLLSLILL